MVLNYSCCGVAVVVLGLNWPVYFPPLSQVRNFIMENAKKTEFLQGTVQ